jgi:hypothetical protein
VLRDPRNARSYQAEINDLGSRTGIRAIGDRDPEFMMNLEMPLNALSEKIFELSPGKRLFKFCGKRPANDRTVWTAARAEARFDLIALNLCLHGLEKALLADADML